MASRLVVFKLLNCYSDLIMSRWLNVHFVIVEWVQEIFARDGIGVIIALQYYREMTLLYPQHILRIRNQV